ncbi:hypothetical protein SCOCK_260089 [Actinacidiphila cocklensis]|uniref:Uncharacterized protein n=1 Tax=Actinacidiphila cocklensis TaxID=887465 RepID=A0A9W4GT80_9ACTN|nr:hypothetical protein SCOCK_260089 [Actinacidiphila cocklensis]
MWRSRRLVRLRPDGVVVDEVRVARAVSEALIGRLVPASRPHGRPCTALGGRPGAPQSSGTTRRGNPEGMARVVRKVGE